jgi:hypothetical protein
MSLQWSRRSNHSATAAPPYDNNERGGRTKAGDDNE